GRAAVAAVATVAVEDATDTAGAARAAGRVVLGRLVDVGGGRIVRDVQVVAVGAARAAVAAVAEQVSAVTAAAAGESAVLLHAVLVDRVAALAACSAVAEHVAALAAGTAGRGGAHDVAVGVEDGVAVTAVAAVPEPEAAVAAGAAVGAVAAVAPQDPAVTAVAGVTLAVVGSVQAVADQPTAVADHRPQGRVGAALLHHRRLSRTAPIASPVERQPQNVFLVRDELHLDLRGTRHVAVGEQQCADTSQRSTGDACREPGGHIRADRHRAITLLGMPCHGSSPVLSRRIPPPIPALATPRQS